MKRKLFILTTMIFAFFFLTCIGICQAQDFIKGFSLKVTGGYGTMATGDYNTVFENVEQYYDDLIALIESMNGFQVSKTGGFKKINMGLEFEGEIIIDLSGPFGIGFGVGYIRRSNESEIGFSMTGIPGLSSSSLSYEPIITVTPVNLSLYFFPSVAPSMNFYLYGGLGYYMGKLTDTSKSVRDGFLQKSEWEFKDKGFGFHAGAGLEFNIAPKVAIFIEGKGRYCKLKSWEGHSDSESGTVWYLDIQASDTNKWYSLFALQEDKPSGDDIRNVREFALNLTGISLRTGIRIKF